MNKIKTFHGTTLSTLEYNINGFAKTHKIINTSICTEKYGYEVYYTILVLYEEN